MVFEQDSWHSMTAVNVIFPGNISMSIYHHQLRPLMKFYNKTLNIFLELYNKESPLSPSYHPPLLWTRVILKRDIKSACYVDVWVLRNFINGMILRWIEILHCIQNSALIWMWLKPFTLMIIKENDSWSHVQP